MAGNIGLNGQISLVYLSTISILLHKVSLGDMSCTGEEEVTASFIENFHDTEAGQA